MRDDHWGTRQQVTPLLDARAEAALELKELEQAWEKKYADNFPEFREFIIDLMKIETKILRRIADA